MISWIYGPKPKGAGSSSSGKRFGPIKLSSILSKYGVFVSSGDGGPITRAVRMMALSPHCAAQHSRPWDTKLSSWPPIPEIPYSAYPYFAGVSESFVC
jgi:hypothetical protein